MKQRSATIPCLIFHTKNKSMRGNYMPKQNKNAGAYKLLGILLVMAAIVTLLKHVGVL